MAPMYLPVDCSAAPDAGHQSCTSMPMMVSLCWLAKTDLPSGAGSESNQRMNGRGTSFRSGVPPTSSHSTQEFSIAGASNRPSFNNRPHLIPLEEGFELRYFSMANTFLVGRLLFRGKRLSQSLSRRFHSASRKGYRRPWRGGSLSTDYAPIFLRRSADPGWLAPPSIPNE